ncbi:DUF3093 domain-containing protein [Streptomyces palmae]|uniref:DUF3093 domain-containing protein n=1 Tax=Streptomyces palmae TaxID=1701085 RepID=A0A4Z0HAQ2_9ACTN|nr:DUF3093 domain-containing protein [Streptomyces palmae]TGB12026.1 DUF3093 domain-containing protein [Streptomyces palmae]
MPLYHERLAVPRVWWLFVFLAGLATGLIALPLGAAAAGCGLLLGSGVGAAVAFRYGASSVRVTPGSLVAGPIRLPIEALGLPEILDAEEALAWRTFRADPHALMLLRGYVPTALRIEITDPRYRAPYLYLSTRQPMTLAAVLAFARRPCPADPR